MGFARRLPNAPGPDRRPTLGKTNDERHTDRRQPPRRRQPDSRNRIPCKPGAGPLDRPGACVLRRTSGASAAATTTARSGASPATASGGRRAGTGPDLKRPHR